MEQACRCTEDVGNWGREWKKREEKGKTRKGRKRKERNPLVAAIHPSIHQSVTVSRGSGRVWSTHLSNRAVSVSETPSILLCSALLVFLSFPSPSFPSFPSVLLQLPHASARHCNVLYLTALLIDPSTHAFWLFDSSGRPTDITGWTSPRQSSCTSLPVSIAGPPPPCVTPISFSVASFFSSTECAREWTRVLPIRAKLLPFHLHHGTPHL